MRLLVFPVIFALLSASGLAIGSSRSSTTGDPEKIFSAEEVDKAADIKNIDRVFATLKKSLKCEGEGTVKLSFVLRKSGKVTDIKIENTMQCDGKANAMNILRKLRFTPAMKNRVRVSTSETLEIKVESMTTIG